MNFTIPQESLNRFRRHLRRLAQWDLGMGRAEAAQFSATACKSLNQDRDFSSLGRSMEDEGLSERWNAVCASRRAPEIAMWVLPHVQGSVMDLLCGDGCVGENLARRGGDTLLMERRGAYEVDRAAHSAPFVFFEDSECAPVVDTVLLSTVLHHELNPDRLLKAAGDLARRRLILVENCLEAEYPADYQEFMDLFFNHCLNHTSLDSPMSHRTPAGWIEACSFFGRAIHVERKERLPGIPLSHHLIVIEKR